MTPRRIRSEVVLLKRRRVHHMAENLVVGALGAQGKEDGIKKQIETWTRM